MKKTVITICLLLILGTFLGISFAKARQEQPQVLPNPSSPSVLGVFKNSSPTPNDVTVGTPVKLAIPKINVKATVEEVGLDKLNRMDVPRQADDVGWYKLGVKPGEVGNAVIDGHLDRIDLSPAVFWSLKNLQIGDQLQIQDDQDRRLNFKVTDIESYPWNNFPLQQVFGSTNKKNVKSNYLSRYL